MLVHNKGRYIRHFGDVRLIPGTNELDAKQAAELNEQMQYPLNKALLNKEIVIVGGEKAEGKSIADLNVNDTAILVADTFDVALLEKWLEAEKADKKRKTVILAIEEQIEAIKNPDKEDIVDPEE